MANLITEDDIDFSAYEQETEARQNVKSAALYVQQLIDRMNSPVKERRHFMPWGKTHGKIAFRPGEVTVWGGANGSGKSIITGQVALSLCAQDQRVGIASFEMKPVRTLERMSRQWTRFNLSDPAILCDPYERSKLMDLMAQFRGWTEKSLWLYDQQGTVHWKQVCAVARYCAKELGISHFFIDNLMKCVAGEDDYNGQKAFVDELCAIARDHDIHIHLIHHIKKPASDDHMPSKYDFKGTGAITDQPDNVIAVWRNKTKERKLQDHRRSPTKTLAPPETEPDARLIVDKQRNGDGWEGHIGLWYHSQSQQFLAGHNHKPMEFINAPEATDADAF